MKKKVLVVTGSRAEYGLLKLTMEAIMLSKKLDLRLLVTGMHTLKKHGYTIFDIKRDKIPINCVVPVLEKDSMLEALNKEISGISRYCIKNRPDLILVLGDRDEPFAAAIVGGHLNIPIAHINGGDVTGKIIDEAIRHSITKFSHLHFTATPKSRERVLKLGENPKCVFLTGAPGIEGLKQYKFLSKKILGEKFGIPSGRKWFLIVHHPATLEKISFRKQINGLLKTVDKFGAEKIIIYPNSDTGNDIFIKEIEKYRDKKMFHIFKNLPRADYLNFLNVADLMAGNSSSGIIESAYFHLPTVNIGSRQGKRERSGNVIDCSYDSHSITAAINKASSRQFIGRVRKINGLYGSGPISGKIVGIIERHIDDNDLLDKQLTY